MDLCRQCIIFETIRDVADCLAAIRDDEEVHVVRVKNRIHDAYDAAQSAGYRDVAINLKIVNTATVL